MDTLIIAGSPRKDMYSDRIAKLINKKTDGKVVHLREKKISPCHACEYCHEVRKGECIQRDDMTELYAEFRGADTIVLVSPIYWWQVTAQMKTFMDRLYALGEDDWKGKKAVVILNGGAEDNDVEFIILHNAFKEMFDYLGVEYSFLGLGTSSEDDWNKKQKKLEDFINSNFPSL